MCQVEKKVKLIVNPPMLGVYIVLVLRLSILYYNIDTHYNNTIIDIAIKYNSTSLTRQK